MRDVPTLSSEARFVPVTYDATTPAVTLLDQRALPTRETHLVCRDVESVARGIRDMVVRGAPAIGIAAGYGIALEARRVEGSGAAFAAAMTQAGELLGATRPTAVNLRWAIARMLEVCADVADAAPEVRSRRVEAEARTIHREDVEACRAMGALGAVHVPVGANVLTHCNAGALATGGYGTALGVVRAAWAAGRIRHVFACETRPYLQGARLTSWELHQDGIPVTVITDSMVGALLARGEVQYAVVGADRIARNGDVANKIGTYGLAVLCNVHGVPFTVAAPTSTLDASLVSGESIPIEERSADEVAIIAGQRMVLEGIPCRHPAFDITPARWIDRITTERGSIVPKAGESIDTLLA